MNNWNIDRLIVLGQLGMSFMFLAGYFVIMILILVGQADVPSGMKDTFGNLVSILTAFSGAIVYFWFQRARSKGTEPDPTQHES